MRSGAVGRIEEGFVCNREFATLVNQNEPRAVKWKRQFTVFIANRKRKYDDGGSEFYAN